MHDEEQAGVEELNRRIAALEQRKPCGCSDAPEDRFVELTNGMVMVASRPVSRTLRVIVIRVKAEAGAAQLFTPAAYCTVVTEKDETVMSFLHPADKRVDYSVLLSRSVLAGLGNGRCRCCKWGNWKCHWRDFNEDCVDREAYLNRLDDFCDSTCQCAYIGSWVFNPNC
jgi:hypothetical protein